MRCGRCGGNLRADASKCDYCDGEITLEERGLSGVCPRCYARLLKDARFCTACGVGTAPETPEPALEGASCPRCRGSLRPRRAGSASFIECASCAGLWLAQADLESICEQADRQELVSRALAESVPTRPVDPRAGPVYVPCPTCKSLMIRRNFGGSSGVLIDHCKGHGVWLDHRELEAILAFVRRGGLLKAHEREVERLKREAERARAHGLGGGGLEAAERTPAGEIGLLDALACIGRVVLGRLSG